MSNQEFLSSIKAGQYVKVQYRSDKPYVRKVTKTTRTQIVMTEFWYDDTPHTDRFRISDGIRMGDSWYAQTRIVSEPVLSEEIAAYESRIAERERMRSERKRLRELESWANGKLFALLGERIPADKIKVQFSSSDGLKTFSAEIKCEKVSEQELIAALDTR